MKEEASPPILKFVGVVKGTIFDTVTQELVSTGEQIAQIEGLVIDTVTQEPVLTKEQL